MYIRIYQYAYIYIPKHISLSPRLLGASSEGQNSVFAAPVRARTSRVLWWPRHTHNIWKHHSSKAITRSRQNYLTDTCWPYPLRSQTCSNFSSTFVRRTCISTNLYIYIYTHISLRSRLTESQSNTLATPEKAKTSRVLWRPRHGHKRGNIIRTIRAHVVCKSTLPKLADHTHCSIISAATPFLHPLAAYVCVQFHAII